MIEGVWSVAINLFFTRYNCSLQASAKVWNMLKDLIAGKKVELQRGANSHQNLPSCLLSKRNQNNEEEVAEEIVDNVILILFRLQDMTLHLF
jgi:cytochrome P450 family 26 subfamily A